MTSEPLSDAEAAQRSGRAGLPRTHTGNELPANHLGQQTAYRKRNSQLETALREIAANPNIPGEVYLAIDALLSPTPVRSTKLAKVRRTWGEMGTAEMVDEIEQLNAENQALRTWVLARCWHHHDWGSWPEDGLNFKVCIECQGWDAEDYDRMSAKGRVPQGKAGEYYSHERRGHQPNCLVGALLQEDLPA